MSQRPTTEGDIRGSIDYEKLSSSFGVMRVKGEPKQKESGTNIISTIPPSKQELTARDKGQFTNPGLDGPLFSSEVELYEQYPERARFPLAGRLLQMKVIEQSVSTDVDVALYQGRELNEIDKVAGIEGVSFQDDASVFKSQIPGGTPFVNVDDERALHLNIIENNTGQTKIQFELFFTVLR
jgi:hypothetical protein